MCTPFVCLLATVFPLVVIIATGIPLSKKATATLIFNPLAGTQNHKRSVTDVADSWKRRGWEVELFATRYAGHAREIAAQAAAKEHMVVISAGGDGTLGEIASGIANSATILAPLPAGTGNSFTKELGMPQPGFLGDNTLVEVSNSLLDGNVHQMDLGRCDENRYWLQWAGAGADAYMVKAVEPRSRFTRRLGNFGYAIRGFASLSGFDGMDARVMVDGRSYEGHLVMATISNCRRYAGGHLVMNSRAVLDDGLFDVWLLKGSGTLRVLLHAMTIALGRHEDHPLVERLSGSSVTIETEPVVPVHFDGDPLGETPLSCQVWPGGLNVLTPQSVPDGLFNATGRPLMPA